MLCILRYEVNITKELRSIPKEKENHPKAIRIKKECSSRKTACPR